MLFLTYLAFLRPEADRTALVLPWVVSQGRSYRFLWADSIIHKKKGRAIQLSLIFQR
jgi:hypothetical protein